MSPTWKAAIGVILVFILGWFGGAVTTLVIARHKALVMLQRGPEAIAIVLERQTTANLGLNQDQKAQLHALIVANLKQRMELQKQIQPQVRALNRQTIQEIDAVLTPGQQQHFHDNLAQFKGRFGRNPFNVGPDDKPVPPAATENTGASQTSPTTDVK